MAIGTTINGLNVVTSLTANDEVPLWDAEASGEPTKKITASNLAASVKSLASLPNTTEMNTAIEQSTAYESITLTAGSGVTINSQECYKYGKLLIIFFNWSCASNLSSYATIATHGYVAKTSWNAPLVNNSNYVQASNGLYADNANTTIRASGTIPAGTYRTFLIIPIE